MTNRGKLSSSEYVAKSTVLWTTLIISAVLSLSIFVFGGMYVFIHVSIQLYQEFSIRTNIIGFVLECAAFSVICFLVIGVLMTVYLLIQEFLSHALIDTYCRKYGVCFHEKNIDEKRCKYLQEEHQENKMKTTHFQKQENENHALEENQQVVTS